MLLKIGAKGDEVKKIQSQLEIQADGIFGAATEKAIKNWQSAHGLTADGIIGDETFAKMFPNNIAEFKLKKLVGHLPDTVITQIPNCVAKFQINSPLRLAHFLAQCSHESGEFKIVQENLNYSVDGLKKIFPKYFPGNLAESYARQPEKIASRVYANRMGNGDEASKEGYKFRGRGYIQLTGKDNYRAFDQTVDDDIVNMPDLVAAKYPLLSAGWFWQVRGLNEMADQGASDAIVTAITRQVNGGTIGLSERIKNFKQFYALLA